MTHQVRSRLEKESEEAQRELRLSKLVTIMEQIDHILFATSNMQLNGVSQLQCSKYENAEPYFQNYPESIGSSNPVPPFAPTFFNAVPYIMHAHLDTPRNLPSRDMYLLSLILPPFQKYVCDMSIRFLRFCKIDGCDSLVVKLMPPALALARHVKIPCVCDIMARLNSASFMYDDTIAVIDEGLYTTTNLIIVTRE